MHMFWRTNDGIGGAGRNTEFASDAKLWINYGRFKGKHALRKIDPTAGSPTLIKKQACGCRRLLREDSGLFFPLTMALAYSRQPL